MSKIWKELMKKEGILSPHTHLKCPEAPTKKINDPVVSLDHDKAVSS